MKGIPFLVFDAGGVLEMFDPKEFEDNVVFEPTLAALKRKLSAVVAHGRIKTVELARHITTGRQQWLQWHADFAENLQQLVQVLWAAPPLPGARGSRCATQIKIHDTMFGDRLEGLLRVPLLTVSNSKPPVLLQTP